MYQLTRARNWILTGRRPINSTLYESTLARQRNQLQTALTIAKLPLEAMYRGWLTQETRGTSWPRRNFFSRCRSRGGRGEERWKELPERRQIHVSPRERTDSEPKDRRANHHFQTSDKFERITWFNTFRDQTAAGVGMKNFKLEYLNQTIANKLNIFTRTRRISTFYWIIKWYKFFRFDLFFIWRIRWN